MLLYPLREITRKERKFLLRVSLIDIAIVKLEWLGWNCFLLIKQRNQRLIHQSKDGKGKRDFDTLEWLTAICSHVPNKGEQIVRLNL